MKNRNNYNLAKIQSTDIQLNVKGFLLKINRSSNNNVFAYIFEDGKKMPLAGTAFADNDTDEDIKNWANRKVASHLSGGENKDLLNAFNLMI
jgi:hypothetical protein